MAKASPATTNFNAGEFSPLLDGRIDLQKYPNAASVLENFIPTVQGPIRKRGGTLFINQTKNNTACVLIPFEFSVSQAYIVEFGNKYARFYTADAQTGVRGALVDSTGNYVEVSTPYGLNDILNTDGSTKLRFAQTADVLYICCPNYPVYLLKRTSATSFSFEHFEFKNGPFDDLNADDGISVYADAQYGAVTLTANSGIFKPEMVGSLFYIEIPSHSAVKPWEATTEVSMWELRKSDGKFYQCVDRGFEDENKHYTGTIKPVHSSGREWDGVSKFIDSSSPNRWQGVLWEYHDAGYGYVYISSYISSTQVYGVVTSRLPAGVVGSENATSRWAYGAWGPHNGYPTSVAFFRSRLWFARGQKVWGSVVSSYTDFAAKDSSEVTADMAISLSLSSGKINDIQWLLPDKDLIAGTAAGEFAIGELSNGDALGPDNIRAILQSEYGSKAIQPVKNGSSILFIQRAGLKAREFYYSIGNEGYVSEDATTLSEHITYGKGFQVNSGLMFGVSAMAFAQEPDPIIWMIRTDKQLIGFTWNNEQQVKGWHRHVTQGDVEAIAVIPALEGDRDELWLCVKRAVDGQDHHYIECMMDPYHSGDAVDSQFYVDCGLSYRGNKTHVISGLEHLEGSEVAILADGAVVPNQVVKNGEIKLTYGGRVVHVGLPFEAVYRSMRIEAGAADGTAQGKIKRINKIAYRLLDTGSGKYGATASRLDEFQFRTPSDAMNKAVPLFSGDIVVDFPGDYDLNGYLMFVSDKPHAAALIGAYPQVTTQDR